MKIIAGNFPAFNQKAKKYRLKMIYMAFMGINTIKIMAI